MITDTYAAQQKILTDAFNRVANPTNWKLPVDATVVIADDADKELISRAVVHFTGAVPTFVKSCLAQRVGTRGQMYRVRAAGYYRTIGA